MLPLGRLTARWASFFSILAFVEFGKIRCARKAASSRHEVFVWPHCETVCNVPKSTHLDRRFPTVSTQPFTFDSVEEREKA